MFVCAKSLLRQLRAKNKKWFSTVTQIQPTQEKSLDFFRTSVVNPVYHTKEHLGRFYKIPDSIITALFQKSGMPIQFWKQGITFNEYTLLVRKPALEILSYINETDFTKPVNKYVIYGKKGVGKSCTCTHLMHYAYMKEFIIFNIPEVSYWYRFPKEVTNSESHPGMLDLPIVASNWLKRFQFQNKLILHTLDLKLSKKYEWSYRESNEENSPLMELIKFGIDRPRYATQVINALVSELKTACTMDKCKVFVMMEGYNALFIEETSVRNENKKFVPPCDITITEPLLNITKADWNNGIVVLTVDIRSDKENKESELPKYLLRRKGFEHLDPFMPIQVENYTDEEFETVVAYYKDRRWIRDITPEQQRELYLLSKANPHELWRSCSPI